METLNVVTGSGIEGNIGSCGMQITQVVTERHFWTEETLQLATNSCTGTVSEYETWQFTGASVWGGFAILGLMLLAFVWIIIDN